MSDDGWGSPADPQQRDERPAAPEEPPVEPKPKKVDTIDIDVRCFLNKIRIGRIRRQIVQDNTKQSVTIPSKDEIYDQFVNVASEKIYELMDIKPELRTRLEETAKEANSYYMSTKEQFEETYHTRPQLLQNNVQKIISAGDISVIDEILLIQKALTNTDEGRATFQSSFFLKALKCGKVNWLHEYHELLTKLLMVCLLHDRSTVTRLQKEGSPIDTQNDVMMVPTLRNYLNCLKEKRQLVFDLYTSASPVRKLYEKVRTIIFVESGRSGSGGRATPADWMPS
ncbi:hypothetical protein CAEBREN_29402 [Caenorhabditis brenneri]|uniref:Uncharacterized protein n=1 Tax=Caenorhabditis brenneri TaxID=135651 RepID=G0P099_CAEBE|nr:hypothetical protein CAEBREN_29402 [Caenorhabditis brenneri]